jgi:polysaccharide pyruvyl transferase WcaK-like protein
MHRTQNQSARDQAPVNALPTNRQSERGAVVELPTRICIVNFTGERANWGCRATSWELVRILNRHWPDAEMFSFDVIPLVPHHALDRDIPLETGTQLHAALANPAPNDSDKNLVEDVVRRRYLHYVDRLKAADLVIFQGEGTMTGTDFLRAERLLLLPWVAKHCFKKRVISVNQTLFSANADFSRLLFKLLDVLDGIWVRENASLHWLQQNGFKQVRLVPDTAFLTVLLEHGNHWNKLPKRAFFCITGSASLTEESMPAYLQTIWIIANSTGLFPVFVCSTGIDCMLPKIAAEQWPANSFGQVGGGIVYQGVAHLLGQAQMLIGGRYHMSIFAAISGTPSVLIETNTHKLTGLTELLEVDWPIRNANQRNDLVNDAKRELGRLIDTRPALQKRVKSLCQSLDVAFTHWYWDMPINNTRDEPVLVTPPEGHQAFAEINQLIAKRFRYPETDTLNAKLGPIQPLIPQIQALTVYLRRGVDTHASFRCLRQLVEGNLDLAITQLNTRWLISICDSYADFGNPIESRNALLISSFLNWERLAESYALLGCARAQKPADCTAGTSAIYQPMGWFDYSAFCSRRHYQQPPDSLCPATRSHSPSFTYLAQPA